MMLYCFHMLPNYRGGGSLPLLLWLQECLAGAKQAQHFFLLDPFDWLTRTSDSSKRKKQNNNPRLLRRRNNEHLPSLAKNSSPQQRRFRPQRVLLRAFCSLTSVGKHFLCRIASRRCACTMKRPEFLMFALLRSSATALATTGEKIFIPQQTQTIQLRLATRTDVPAIQRCNLSCLPENYNSQFYCSHLRQWPDLALVAEEISLIDGGAGSHKQPRNPLAGFVGGHHEPKIVAYLLGKVETRPLINYNNPSASRCYDVEVLGHVTSLAVQKEYRRLGLAKAMMTQLHHHLQHQGIQSCGLHVRTSNIAACRLYEDDDYQVS
jgi:N-alpha-acetyltransferase 10/11